MDFSLIGAASAAIGAARDITKGAIALRDFNAMAAALAQLNEQLLKAQESLFTHNAQLLELQSDHFKTSEELRDAQERLRERGAYSLFELVRGHFVYRSDVVPQESRPGEPARPQPLHYVCQPCFDRGIKAVLKHESGKDFGPYWWCPSCQDTFGG